MPILNSEEPDSYDIDYYYPKYKDRFGVFIKEADAAILKVMPPNYSPSDCETKVKNTYHYFLVPTQPTISTCICKKYHVSFTSQFYHIPTSVQNFRLKCFSHENSIITISVLNLYVYFLTYAYKKKKNLKISYVIHI